MSHALLLGKESADSHAILTALQDTGFTVRTCETGTEALQRVGHEAVTHILSPLTVDEMDGVRLLQRVKQDDTSLTTAIILAPDEIEALPRVQTADIDVIVTTRSSPEQIQAMLTEAQTDAQLQERRLNLSDLFTALFQLFSTLSEPESKDETERALCDGLVDSGYYTAAWMNRYNADSNQFRPTTAAGMPIEALASDIGEWVSNLQIISEEGSRGPLTEVRIPVGTEPSPYGVVQLVTRRSITTAERDALAFLGEVLSNELASETELYRGHSPSSDIKRYSGIVAHELRNQLQIARRALSTDHSPKASEEWATVEDVLQGIDRIAETANLIAQETVDSDNLAPQSLTETIEMAWDHFERTQASLEIEGSAPVVADHSILVIFFENLFRNSLHHAGPDVSISTGLRADENGFYVEDSGPGIPPAERSRIFEWGYSPTGNTGFGLAIVKQIVAAHGWEITVTESDSGGARFEVSGVTVA